jgi:hypothetical protein
VLFVLAHLLAAPACTPPVRQFALRDQPMTCEDANRYAHDALTSMGFEITAFRPAKSGLPGELRGNPAEKDYFGSATVTISCGAGGPTIEASEDGKWLGQVEFKRAFYMTFTSLISHRRAVAEVEARQAVLPLAERRRRGFEVLITPLRGLEARLDFAGDLEAVGVLPVRVVINNRTEQRYVLDPGEIVMVRGDGKRVPPLPPDEVVERARAAPTPDPGTATSADLPLLLQQLRAKRLDVQSLGHDSSAQGYLYFPLDDYHSARVRVTEAESQETEGFLIEF